MTLFELYRLRREGKDVILPGGVSAISEEQNKMFEDAEKRIDESARRVNLDDLMYIEDVHGLISPTSIER